MVPSTIRTLAGQGVEIRPVPSMYGLYITLDGRLYSIRERCSKNGFMHHSFAHEVNPAWIKKEYRMYIIKGSRIKSIDMISEAFNG